MDFTLALTHFCDLHGPKSVICTQVLPLECAQCAPPPRRERTASIDSYATQSFHNDGQDGRPPSILREKPDPTPTSPLAVREASISDERPGTANIEQHPLFRHSDCTQELNKYPYGRAHGETCASCTFTVPQVVAAKLPCGAPGSLPKDGSKSKNAPVLRSREFICLGRGRKKQTQEPPSSSQDSRLSSMGSFGSTGSHSDCHDHTVTYLTSKSPNDPENYAQLRWSVIRALSCEVLPKGMSEGPFCFGDSTNGYAISYVFRLTDPKARGRRRAYAFVALAGNDANRAFKACPLLWEAFATMSKTIERAAQKYQDGQEVLQQKEAEEQRAKDTKAGYTNVSSFLTQRPRDPDGHPRRANQTQPRSLAEIIGDENIFAILHQYFVAVLRCLGDKFGGLPLAEGKPTIYQTTVHEHEASQDEIPAQVSSDVLADLNLDDDESVGEEQNSLPVEDSSRRAQAQISVTANTAATNATTSQQRSHSPAYAGLGIEAHLPTQVAV